MAQISCDVLVGKSVMAIEHGDWTWRLDMAIGVIAVVA